MTRLENSEVGDCPNCGSMDLDYGNHTPNFEGDSIYFNVECEKCNHAYREYHNLEFDAYYEEEK